MKKLTVLFFMMMVFCTVVSPFGIYAHGVGTTLDAVVGDYAVNVDYDAPFGIIAGDSVQFVFELSDKNRTQKIDFTDVWVSITPADTKGFFGGPIFSGGIAGTMAIPPEVTFVFSSGGSYNLALRFEKDKKTLTEATFPLSVANNQDGGSGFTISFLRFSNDFWKGVLSVLVIGMLALMIRKFFW